MGDVLKKVAVELAKASVMCKKKNKRIRKLCNKITGGVYDEVSDGVLPKLCRSPLLTSRVSTCGAVNVGQRGSFTSGNS